MDPSRFSESRDFQPPTIDTLATCESEPIHIPGAIQPHGCLFDVEGESFTVVRVSSNVRTHFNRGASSVLGRPIGDLLGKEAVALLQTNDQGIKHRSQHFTAIGVDGAARAGTLLVHSYRGRTIVEWLADEEHRFAVSEKMSRELNTALERGRAAESLEAALDIITTAVKNVTNYDRVMLYRFHPDWHGEVVSEEIESGLVAYRGLHYPASDIPVQARRLYVDTKARVITDVYARDAVLMAAPSLPVDGDLDLSHAVTRSVSPVHIQYLRNMGSGATFVTSLLVDGKLWGLIACHHRTRFSVPWYAFERLHQFTQDASDMLAAKIARLAASEARGLEQRRKEMLESLDISITSGLTLLQVLLGSTGHIVVSSDGNSKCVGDVPKTAIAVAKTVFAQSDVGATDAIQSTFPNIEAEASCAGVAWIKLTPDLAVLFIRPEFQRTVTWGGDPDKAIVRDPVTQRLDPRGSFDLWKQTVHGKSRPWHATTIDTLSMVRPALKTPQIAEYLRA